jgi:hypothetical protein
MILYLTQKEYHLIFFRKVFRINLGNVLQRIWRLFMLEEWVTILEFPAYKISNYGNIVNQLTHRPIALSVSNRGILKVSLHNNVGRFTRSVAILVSRVFVTGYNDIFNTLIHLDGNHQNCEASNLMWRPRWFAYQYHRQFTHHKEDCIELLGRAGPVIEPHRNLMYRDILEVAVVNGLLIRELTYKTWLQDEDGQGVWPTGQVFNFMD